MVEICVMLVILSVGSFAGGVIMTKELCCMAAEEERNRKREKERT